MEEEGRWKTIFLKLDVEMFVPVQDDAGQMENFAAILSAFYERTVGVPKIDSRSAGVQAVEL